MAGGTMDACRKWAAVLMAVLAAFSPWRTLWPLEPPEGPKGAGGAKGPSRTGSAPKGSSSLSGEPVSTGEPAARSKRQLIVETAGEQEAFQESAADQIGALRSKDGKRLEGLSVGARTFLLDDLLYLQLPWSPLPEAPMVLFLRARGSEARGEVELAGEVAGGDESFVQWRCPSLEGAPLKIRLEDVKGLIVRGSAGRQGPGLAKSGSPDASGPPSGEALPPPGKMPEGLELALRDQVRSSRKDKDEVVLLEKGRIDGILQSLDRTGLRFSSEKLGDIKIPYAQLRALILAEVEEEAPPGSGSRKEPLKPAGGGLEAPEAARAVARVGVGLRDSSHLSADLLDLSLEGLSLEHEILGSLKVPLGEILEVAFKSGRASYLSDREPIRVREESGPLLRLRFPFRKDSNVLGEPIRMGGTTRRKGLGVHSYSLLEFDLAGEFSRFRATVGLDDSARPEEAQPQGGDEGSVVFRVKLDGKVLFEKGMTWRDPPTPVDLSVEKGKLLALEVDYGPPEGGFNLVRDRANWAEARVVK